MHASLDVKHHQSVPNKSLIGGWDRRVESGFTTETNNNVYYVVHYYGFPWWLCPPGGWGSRSSGGRHSWLNQAEILRCPALHVRRAWSNLPGHYCISIAEWWARGFVRRLLGITHRQWLHRNAKVHIKKRDGKTQVQHEEIMDKVRDLIYTDPMGGQTSSAGWLCISRLWTYADDCMAD